MSKKSNGKALDFLKLFVVLVLIAATFVINLYPPRYRGLIKEFCREYNIEPHLVAAIINVESSYDRKAVSRKEARGLMQISPMTGEWAARELSIENYSPEMLFEPEVNIRMGTWYLRVLSEEFDNNLKLMLAAYNGGSGNVSNWLKDERYSADGLMLDNIPFKETEMYVKKVEKNMKVYKIMYRFHYLLNKVNFIPNLLQC